MNKLSSFDDFQNGLVFGFDVGAETIGYAVRKGAEFRKIGVLLCNSRVGDLNKRRQLRLNRRRLRNQKKRREWFAKELTALGFPKPTKQLHDPISIRLRALNGDCVEPEELHAALTHLFKRRGYLPQPWAKSSRGDEEGKIKSAVKETIHRLGGRHPCQFLTAEQSKIGKSPKKTWARKIYWPQEALHNEFLAIATAQRTRFPVLADKADWLLYGETKIVKGHHVFFKTSPHPGVLSMRWPRFDNRKRLIGSRDKDGVLQQQISGANTVSSGGPILQSRSETVADALNRYFSEIKHPLVRHRLALFRRLLMQLASRYGRPSMVVLEVVPSLGFGHKAAIKLKKENATAREDFEQVRRTLASNQQSISRRSIRRYQLWLEAKGRCPFCLKRIERTELGHAADIDYLVPRATVDCNEFYNLTVAHLRCIRTLKRERTPRAAFGETPQWPDLKENAKKIFSGAKLKIFMSPNAEKLVEQKADLHHMAHLAQVFRRVSLIQLGWLDPEGREPISANQTVAFPFQVTSGRITSRLRKVWGLNQILHPLPDGAQWEKLTKTEKNDFTQRNRADLRQHALDAAVISCTLPWLAYRSFQVSDEFGNRGWWTHDGKQHSQAANPVFPKEGEMYNALKAQIEKFIIRHHVSRSNHQQAYATTLYAKKAKNTYVVREPLVELTPKNLKNIWPRELAHYCEAAWKVYGTESVDLQRELKKTKGCVPEKFTEKLCFSHFQKWRHEGCPEFCWPTEIKTPIRRLRLISLKRDSAVIPRASHSRAFVKRTKFKEVQIFLSQDEKSFVPIFIPFWRGDKIVEETPFKHEAKPVAIFRRGMVLGTKRPFPSGMPAGRYRILVTGQSQVRLLPHHIANKEESLPSFGLGSKGILVRWPDFIRALGYDPLPSASPSA